MSAPNLLYIPRKNLRSTLEVVGTLRMALERERERENLRTPYAKP